MSRDISWRALVPRLRRRTYEELISVVERTRGVPREEAVRLVISAMDSGDLVLLRSGVFLASEVRSATYGVACVKVAEERRR